jgi:hypothetical protein
MSTIKEHVKEAVFEAVGILTRFDFDKDPDTFDEGFIRGYIEGKLGLAGVFTDFLKGDLFPPNRNDREETARRTRPIGRVLKNSGDRAC